MSLFLFMEPINPKNVFRTMTGANIKTHTVCESVYHRETNRSNCRALIFHWVNIYVCTVFSYVVHDTMETVMDF